MTDRCVFIVEDEPLIAMDVELEMRDRGWDIDGPYGTLDDARAAMTDTEADHAILDINVGSATSYELAAALRENGVFIVFLSGSDGDDRPDVLKEIPVVSKPIDYDNLHAVLEERRISA